MFRHSRSKSLMLVSLIVLRAVLVLFREKMLALIGDFLIVQDILEPADVIHVIAGEDFRTDYAFQLYRQGYGRTIFFTGGWCDFYEHGAHAREKALAQGLSLDSIASDDTAVMSTYMEAERSKEWIASRPSPVRSIIVVSDPFHMQRARWTYRKVFGNQSRILMAPVPFERTPYQSAWWKDALAEDMLKRNTSNWSFTCFVINIVGEFLEMALFV